jgi:hypothetical protein
MKKLLPLFLLLGAGNAQADIIHADDVIAQFSMCIGNDCVNGESFGFDTLRLKENNLRINFDDTSTSASFPKNDWRIVINDSANGGASYFAVEDSTAGRTPFKVEAGAPSNSLYVDDGGRVGFGTATPVVDLHAVSGNTPTLRLEQDGSSGFSAQTWDVAGNEAGFFVRDATNGSTLPFRIFPNAPSSSLAIEGTTGDIGIGTTSPSGQLHVKETDSNENLDIYLSTVNQTWKWRVNKTTDEMNFIDDTNSKAPLKIGANANSNLLRVGTVAANRVDITGQLWINGVNNSTPDYVFDPKYDIMHIKEHAKYMWENKHLPAVAKAMATRDGKAVINVGMRSQSVLEELEVAHIYIEQLHDQMQSMQQDMQRMRNELAELKESK